MMNPPCHGVSLLREIALFASAHQPNTGGVLLAITSIRMMIPFIARAIQFKNPAGFDWDGIVYTIIENIILFFFLLQNYFFIYIGFVDFQRRLYMIKATGVLICPLREDYYLRY